MYAERTSCTGCFPWPAAFKTRVRVQSTGYNNGAVIAGTPRRGRHAICTSFRRDIHGAVYETANPSILGRAGLLCVMGIVAIQLAPCGRDHVNPPAGAS